MVRSDTDACTGDDMARGRGLEFDFISELLDERPKVLNVVAKAGPQNCTASARCVSTLPPPSARPASN